MILKILIGILIFVTVIACLPTTFYSVMLYKIICRRSNRGFERSDLSKTQYAPYENEIKESILDARRIPCEEIYINSTDGVRLFGRYYDRGSDKVMVLVHGYNTNSFNNFSFALKAFLSDGYNVLMPDQRAHERSGGRYSTLSNRETDDLLCWVDHIGKKAAVKSIYLYGISMGATVVAKASDKFGTDKVKGLIMESGFTSFYELGLLGFKKNPEKKWSVRYIYTVSKKWLKIDFKESSEQALKNNRIPALFLHAGCDDKVPLEFTMRNYNACGGEKRLITVDGAGHTMCFSVGGEKLYREISDFLNSAQNI